MNDSQCLDLLAHLKKGKTITARSAVVDLGITSLHRRLTDLRERGWLIDGQWIYVQTRKGKKTKVKQYRLIGKIQRLSYGASEPTANESNERPTGESDHERIVMHQRCAGITRQDCAAHRCRRAKPNR